MNIKIEVGARGHVSIEAGSRMITMSPYSGNAQEIARELGTGEFNIPANEVANMTIANAVGAALS